MQIEDVFVTKPTLPLMCDYIQEIEDIWQTGWLTNMGHKHQKLEKSLREYLDVQNISLFSNGHMALEAALSVLPKSGEVITTSFTFVSTTHAIVRAGLTPVFCDVDPKTYTLDPEGIKNLITKDTVAILPVHVYGNLCDWEALEYISKEHGIALIYDAAHAFGVKTGEAGVGKLGDISMFSFHATKVFNTVEGGALCYNDSGFSKIFAAWRQFGIVGYGEVELIGTNAKMNEFQAAMGLCNLRNVEQDINRRKVLVMKYRELLSDIRGIKLCKDQMGVKHNYAYFPVVFEPADFGSSRDEVMLKLERHRIFARKYFYPLTSELRAYRNYNFRANTPVAKHISERILTLPIYPQLNLEQVERICSVIIKK